MRTYNTYMSKLTLSIDDAVIGQAKKHARRRGMSVSKMVEEYFRLITEPPKGGANTPVLDSLRGTLKRGSVEDYRRHLKRKYSR